MYDNNMHGERIKMSMKISNDTIGKGICNLPVCSVVPQFASINPLKPELNPIFYLLALLGAHHFLHVNRIWVKLLTFRRLMSYIWSTHS